MIRASWRFEVRHPYLSVLISFSNVALLALLLWGWIALRFSPVQRHYLPTYMECSIGALSGNDLEYVAWIEKKAPGKVWEIAQPGDLIPVGGDIPFKLSSAARVAGWNDLGWNTNGRFRQRDVRVYLEEIFFDGQSFWFLFLQPFEGVLIAFLCWKMFDNWRKDMARERGAMWDPNYRPASWQKDLVLFLKTLFREVQTGVVQSWTWASKQRRRCVAPALATAVPMPSALSQDAEAGPSLASTPRQKAPRPAAPKTVEVVSFRSTETPAPVTKPSAPPPLIAQATETEPTAEPAPTSPFGGPAAGQPERKWDLSQWIE